MSTGALSPLAVMFAAVLAVTIAGCESYEEPPAPETDLQTFERINERWRSAREARLTEPYGWLSLVGLEPIDDGVHTVGESDDNDIVVPDGGEVWGEIRVVDGVAEFQVEASAVDITIDGEIRPGAVMSTSDRRSYVQGGRVRIEMVAPGDRLAVRIRDPQAPSRTGFEGLDYFDPDPDWRIEADWVEHPEEQTIPVANVLGQLIDEPNPGRVEFEFDGETYSLEALESDHRLWFIFADRTTGQETYGLGRYLYAELPENDRVMLDFNQAYNPPCAFNAYTTCPLPPPENRLDAAVRAGEKTYRGPPGLSPARIEDLEPD